MIYSYGDAESALIATLAVQAVGVSAFRAKIRHLRNIGIPHIDRPGSGKKASYSYEYVAQLACALALQQVGVTPRIAATLAPELAKIRDGSVAVLSGTIPSFSLLPSDPSELVAVLQSTFIVTILNLTQLRLRLDAALETKQAA